MGEKSCGGYDPRICDRHDSEGCHEWGYDCWKPRPEVDARTAILMGKRTEVEKR